MTEGESWDVLHSKYCEFSECVMWNKCEIQVSATKEQGRLWDGLLGKNSMTDALDEKAKRTLLRMIPHPLNICGVKQGDSVNGFTLSWTTQASFKPPLIVIGVKGDLP